MRRDKVAIPDLGDKLMIMERATGYRQPVGADGYKILLEIFGCDDAGLANRLAGRTRISGFDMSRIVHRFGLDVHDIRPEHLLEPAQAFEALLIARGAGIYGRAEPMRFAAAAVSRIAAASRNRTPPRPTIAITPLTRGAGFGIDAPDPLRGPEPHWLEADRQVYVLCTGPAEGRLLLLDHRLDAAAEVWVISPAGPTAWSAPDARRVRRVPPPGTGALHVRPEPGERRLTALWLDEALAEEVEFETGRRAAARADTALPAATPWRGARPDPGPHHAIRALPLPQLAALTAEMTRDTGRVRAVAARDYRVIGQPAGDGP